MKNPIVCDLKAIVAGVGAKSSPHVRLTWVDDAKGRPALRIEPTKTEFAIAEDGSSFGATSCLPMA